MTLQQRTHVASGSPYEPQIGFCRALRQVAGRNRTVMLRDLKQHAFPSVFTVCLAIEMTPLQSEPQAGM